MCPGCVGVRWRAGTRCARAGTHHPTWLVPRAWFPGPRGGRWEGGMSRREGLRVTFLRKICRSGPQPRPESSGCATLSHATPPPPTPELGGPPPPPVLPRGPGQSGTGEGSDFPPESPSQDSLTPMWKEALALFALWGHYSIHRPSEVGDGGGGNPSEHPGGGHGPHLLTLPHLFRGAPHQG